MMKIYETHSYKIISDFYGKRKAKRSQIYYMNHINEGLIVLEQINASLEAQEGFCLHPLFQTDKDLKKNMSRLEEIIKGKLYLLALAMEYRSVANEYLSPHGILNPQEIRLSPIKDVNDMLIADKVQNRKDFEKNRDKYSNKDVLDVYFKVWLTRLGITEKKYHFLISKIKTSNLIEY